MAATWARLVIAMLVSLLVAGCGGGDKQPSTTANAGSAAPTATPTPPVVGGGGAIQPAQPVSATRAAARRFRREVKERCLSVGTPARVSASPESPDDRQAQMAKEIKYLEALDEALGEAVKQRAERGTAELRRLLERYRRRLRDQRDLDERIATAQDSYSVGVGISQNEKNRDARNEIVAEARFDACLRAPKLR